MEAQEIKRGYIGSDASMTATARITHALLTGELAKFTAFDTTMNAAYAAQFLAAINAADTVVADSAVIDQQAGKTEMVLSAMDKARGKYADVKYFVQKAFPDSLATQNEFGLNDYENARRNKEQMIQFLDELHKACVIYQQQLIAKGYTAAAIAEIQTIRTELQSKNTTQELFKRQRTKLTEDRILILNTCYNMMTQVNAAAQLVYRTDYAKQKQFVYSPSPGTATQEYSGTVAAGATKTIATIPYEAGTVFTFSNTGVAPLVFCLSSTASFEGREVPIGGGALVTKTAEELNAEATFLLVKNTDPAVEGTYEVEIG